VVPAALFGWLLSAWSEVEAGGALRESLPWVPTLGVSAAFSLDGLALLFGLLITGIGALVVVYTGRYLEGDPIQGRFYGFLFLFMGAMLGLVLADDLITLFVFWELTSISSYLLIGYKHEKASAREAARQALLVTGAGGLALLVGFLLLGATAGTFTLHEIPRGAVVESAAYPVILILLLAGAFTKSAQVPFHFWLPNAMAAPTPVSAYLHSATMVKAGVYLLARMDPLLGGTALWTWTLTPVGSATMVVGAVLALRETDLKRILAYSTVMALGTLVALLGLSFPDALKAAVVFLIVHSLYKGALFLAAGAVEHSTGTRDLRELGGLGRSFPWLAAGSALAGLSMAGLPPLFGFIAKELTYKAKLGVPAGEFILPTAAVVANILTVAAAGLVTLRPFVGSSPRPRSPHRLAPALVLGTVVLGVASLAFGVAADTVARPLVETAASGILGQTPEVELALWYGFNPALALSVVTVVGGVIAYLRADTLRRGLHRLDPLLRRGPEAGYGAALAGLVRVAEVQTRVLAGGSLSGGLRTVLSVAAVLLWVGILRAGLVGPDTLVLPRAGILDWLLVGVVIVEAVAAVRARSRLGSAAALGAMGFAVALLYVRVGGPDLALTQFLVETLIVLVLVLVIQRLPAVVSVPTPGARPWLDAGVALAVGGAVTALLLGMLQHPFDPSLGAAYVDRSVPDGFGRNVVNVILVDFRALDTLGEITVLAIAALGVTALLSPREAAPDSEHPELPLWRASAILRTAARFLVPLLILFSWFLLWRGHNEPGGGFIGGLVAAGALALHALARGPRSARRLLRAPPAILTAVGILAALSSGIPGVLRGEPFMTALWTTLPGEAAVKLGTPLLFDVGVYLVVVGFTLGVLLTLERSPRRRPTRV
jgi:multicomponent Na+:H+ antiporter subunit A